MWINRLSRWVVSVALGVVLLTGSARGIINPQFTPAELVRSAAQIVELEISAPAGHSASARVVAVLKGAALAETTIALRWDEQGEVSTEAVAAALGGEKSATAILFTSRRAGAGVIQIGTLWFSATQQPDGWKLTPDTADRFSVWAGSAKMLARASRYVLSDPKASFPVKSEMTWGSDLHIGKVTGRVNGCIAADLGGELGLCVIILAEGGDRIFSLGSGKPVEVTEKVQLRTASRVAAPGDFDGDGRMDLVCWDGKALRLAAQTPGGAFAIRAMASDLRECTSLACIDAGGARAGLVAGTTGGPALLVADDKEGYAVRPLAADSAGSDGAGTCVAADFDQDGRCDVMEISAGGMTWFGGEGGGRFKTPVRSAMPLVKRPAVGVCGDYDADGLLDLLVGGGDGLALLSRNGQGRWGAVTQITGELAYHGNANQPRIAGGWPCDVNNDGRQGVALFYPNRNPMVFFNRGFACFGLARELALSGEGAAAAADAADPFAQASDEKLKGAEALQHGQSAGAVLDVDGDGVLDLLGVDLKGEIWALTGKREGGRAGLTLALPAKAMDPVTVTVVQKGRCAGMYVVRAGVPARVGGAEAGPMTLRWVGREGKARERVVKVSESMRFELAM